MKKRELFMFTGSWCGPCQVFKPTFEEAARKNPEVKFKMLDAMEHKALADRYQVQTVPYLLYFVNGSLVSQKPHPTNMDDITDILEKE